MTTDTLMLFTRLCGFKIRVLANRLACDNEIAHLAHARMLEKLDLMIAEQRHILSSEWSHVTSRGTGTEEDSHLDMEYMRSEFFDRWMSETNALLDDVWVDRATREFFDPRTQTWHFCEAGIPIVVPVPSAKLCGLSEIIAQLDDETGIPFAAEHVYYSEAEAEAALWDTRGQDPAVIDEGPEATGL